MIDTWHKENPNITNLHTTITIIPFTAEMIQSIQTKILPRSCCPHTRRTEFDNYIYIDNNIYILSRPACAEVST